MPHLVAEDSTAGQQPITNLSSNGSSTTAAAAAATANSSECSDCVMLQCHSLLPNTALQDSSRSPTLEDEAAAAAAAAVHTP
jgi:hypothetical protein